MCSGDLELPDLRASRSRSGSAVSGGEFLGFTPGLIGRFVIPARVHQVLVNARDRAQQFEVLKAWRTIDGTLTGGEAGFQRLALVGRNSEGVDD